jgi:hypothetical protein
MLITASHSDHCITIVPKVINPFNSHQNLCGMPSKNYQRYRTAAAITKYKSAKENIKNSTLKSARVSSVCSAHSKI